MSEHARTSGGQTDQPQVRPGSHPRRKAKGRGVCGLRTSGRFVTLGLVLAACTGGGTTPTPGPSGSAGASQPAAADQVLRVDLGGEPPTLDPTQATDSQSINVLRSITRPLVYFDKDLQVFPDWPRAGTSARTARRHLPPEGRDQVQRWHAIVAADFVTSLAAADRSAQGRRLLLRHARRRRRRAISLGVDTETATDAAIDAPCSTKFGVEAPDDKTFVVTSRTRRPTSSRSPRCGSPRPCARTSSLARPMATSRPVREA